MLLFGIKKLYPNVRGVRIIEIVLWNDLSEMKEPTKIIFWGEFCVKLIFLTKNGVKSELFYFTNKHTQK